MKPEQALTLPSTLRKHAAANDTVAIMQAIDTQGTSPERAELLFKELYSQVVTVVSQLRSIGIGRNDRVAVALPNGPEAAVAFLAIASGATYAPLNPNYRAPEYEFYLKDLEAKALIVQPGVAEPAREVAQQLNIPVIELSPRLDAAAGMFELNASGVSVPNRSVSASTAPETLAPETLAPETLDFAEPDDTAMILHTSGTTSRPKMVPLSHRNLCTSAYNVAATLDLTETDRCLNVMPLFHIHGLIGALLSSMVAGASVVCTPGFDASRFLGWLKAHQPTWYSAVPTMHQSVLAQAQQQGVPSSPLRLIRSSSAAMPARVMADIEAIFAVPVIEAYGMTEASHQMASNPLPPATRKPRSVGIAGQTKVAIAATDSNELLPQGHSGEVVIQGDAVTQGYVSNPAANDQAFFDGWFRTGDQGYLDEEGYLFLQGRLKEIVNRGGEKISPLEVDEVLMGRPEVHQAVAFGIPHPTLGEDLAAAVVLKPGVEITADSLRDHLFSRVASFKVPSQIILVDAIPKGATGKLQRIGLAEKLAEQLNADYVAPRNEIEQAVADVIQQILKCDRISVTENFFVMGGDSLKGTQVTSRLSAQYGVNLPNTSLFRYPTVESLATEIIRLKDEDEGAVQDVLAQLEGLSPEEIESLLQSANQ